MRFPSPRDKPGLHALTFSDPSGRRIIKCSGARAKIIVLFRVIQFLAIEFLNSCGISCKHVDALTSAEFEQYVKAGQPVVVRHPAPSDDELAFWSEYAGNIM